LTAGSYTVTVTDSYSCTVTTGVTINAPSAIVLTMTSVNSSCGQQADGSATVSLTGGTLNYSYSWSNGSSTPNSVLTTNTINGVGAGSYSVTVTDGNGCTANGTVSVNDNAAPSSTISASSNVSCNGGNNVSATVTVTGGSPNYNYSWSNGSATPNSVLTSNTISGLIANTYTVTVTDANGCITTSTVTITEPTTIVAAISSQTNVLCNGGLTGSATIAATGGSLPYTYVWSTTPSQATATATGLQVGTYTATATDANSCTATASVTITEPTLLTTSIVGINVTCNGSSDGNATVTASGGSPAYTYLWSNGATSSSAVNLSANTYTVTVTDLNLCIATATVTITQPAALGATIVSSTDVSGFGANDGSATVTGTNGTLPYSYLWSNGATGATANNLSSGIYVVTVTDANGCTATTTVTINEPGALVITIDTITNVTCNGACNGTAVIIVNGGITPYTYSWPNGDTTDSVTGLCAGSHTVTVTDANGYIGNITINITQPTVMSGTESANISVNCNGGTDGSASVAASGGTGPYTYLWSIGGTSDTHANLASGSFTVTITDANNCTVTVPVIIAQPNAFTATVVSANGANCGQPQGSLSANPTGGTAPYTYLWNSTPQQITQTASNLTPGNYTVTVTDAHSCTVTASGIISNIPGVATAVKSTINPSCFGYCNGSALLESTGGLTPYFYICSNGYTTSTSNANTLISNLCAGNYSVTITDANNCQTIVTFVITQPAPVVATVSSSTNVNCNGGNNGTATVTGSGGTSPYTAIWNTIPQQNTLTANNLIAGTYQVTITDVNGCTADTSIVITQPAAITLTINSFSAHCGLADGSATVVASGGTVTTGYNYLWSGGTPPLAQQTITGLTAAGSPYIVTVTDNNSCTATSSVTIADIPPGTAAISSQINISCFGANNGSATASIGGGQSPFTYVWSTTPPQSSITASNLPPGPYTVSITDYYNCVVTATVIISQPALLLNNFNIQNASCYGQNTGSVNASPMGGTPPYSYIWNNFETSQIISNVGAGTYFVTITDAHNCSVIDTAVVTQPTQINITGTVTDATCNHLDGAINTTITGGITGYSYHWSNGPSTANITAIAAGTYSITVTDGAGCTASHTFNVNNISGPTAAISASSNVTCYGMANGYATVSATGGTLSYTYQWNTNPVQPAATATNLGPGIYSVTVTDINTNCTANASVTITEPANLTMLTYINESLCNGQCNGDAASVPVGGTAPYSFNWFGGGLTSTDSSITGLCAGTYTIVLTDANGCNETQTITVNQPPFISATTSSTSLTCYGICDGTVTVNALGGTLPYTYNWGNTSQTTQTAFALCAGTYGVTVTDAHGCTENAGATVSSPSQIMIQLIDLQNVKCYGQSSGRIIISVTGGIPGFSYSWSNGATTQNLIGIPMGVYCLTVTDQNGCSRDTCFNVYEPQQIQISLTKTDETCYQFCDGTITSTVTGGVTPYSYLWSNFSTTQTVNNLCPGNYNLSVTDANNCVTSATTTIVGYDILSLLLVHVDTATCGQANGAAIISVIGGSSNYTYNWPAGVNSSSTIAANLAAGFYTVTVVDDNNCSATLDINISNAAGPVIDSIVIHNVTCNGVHDGSLHVYFTSSTTNNSIQWSTVPVQTTAIASNLGPGVYSVVITDDNGCITSTSRPITQPQLFQSAVTNHTDVTCYGSCNGAATSLVYGGIAPYTYLWPDGTTANAVNGLCAGDYIVTATDANGCTATSSITITQPDSLHIDAQLHNVTCNGQNNGQIIIQASGGTGYFYNWFPNVSGNSVAAPLAPGTYTVIVTDYYDLNCSATGTYIITEPEVVTVNTFVEPTTCGLNNGMAYILGSIYGGTPPYNYIWSPGNSTNDTLYNAAAGTYQLQVFDGNSCSSVFPVTVTSISPPILNSLSTVGASCYGEDDGSALISIKYGTGPFFYTWIPFVGNETQIDSSTTNLNNLVAGIYNVSITDVNGCHLQTTFIINQPAPIHVFADGSNYICMGQTTTISANAAGGSAPYSFMWTSLSSTSQVQYVSPNTTTSYNVYAVDQNNCMSDTASVTVNVYPPVTVQLFADTMSICKGHSTSLHAVASGGNGGSYNYYWPDLGDTLPIQDREVTPVDTMTYYVYGVDGCGSPSIPDSVTIIVWPVPPVNILIDKFNGCAPLEVHFRNTGNATNLSYNWNFNDPNSNNNTSLDKNPFHLFEDAGTYTVHLVVTTLQGCSASDNQVITVFPVPNAEFYAYPEVVSLFHARVEFLDISGNMSSWAWDFGDRHYSNLSAPEHTFEDAGIYHVWLFVTNEYGCKDSVMHDIEVQQEHTFYAPTAFDPTSPRGNKFNPQGVGIDENNYQLWIFDRWGEIIFETKDLYEYWNGKFFGNGDYVKSGTYAWIVKLKDIHGKWHEYSGPVTVIR
ncbi:MAG: gliding motility-associated C-terminal domain-containing protein, partial [Bacteroidia bacterium]|nr:gliding motility-associated C-terminal domain-containing protein [Bacteroidia bacterium]